MKYLFLILLAITNMIEAKDKFYTATISAAETNDEGNSDNRYLHQISFSYSPEFDVCELKDIEVTNACNDSKSLFPDGLYIDSIFITKDNSTSLKCSSRELLKNKFEVKISYEIGLHSREFNFVLNEHNDVLDFSGLTKTFNPIENKNSIFNLNLLPKDQVIKSNCENIKLKNDSIN